MCIRDSRETMLMAARMGMGSLGFGFETPDEAEERVGTYWGLMRDRCHPIGKAVNPALCILSQFACAETEEEAATMTKRFLSYLPSSVFEVPPVLTPDQTDPADRREEELFTIIPRKRTTTFDMRRAIRLMADRGSFFEIGPLWGTDQIVGFVRFNGYPMGVVASDCRHINGGAMNGFIGQAEKGRKGCIDTANPICTNSAAVDVMGWHDAREIPNYWTYAHDFVLQDHMFEPNASWSLPAHLFMVSAWSAHCGSSDPSSCVNNIVGPVNIKQAGPGGADYAWTDLTYLMFKAGVSWKYYVQSGTQPDCANDAADCPPVNQNSKTPGIWNPLPYFNDVREDGQLGNITDVTNYDKDARQGKVQIV